VKYTKSQRKNLVNVYIPKRSTPSYSCLMSITALHCSAFPYTSGLITKPFSCYMIRLPVQCIFRINIFACVRIISVSAQGRKGGPVLHNMKQLQVPWSIVPSPPYGQLFRSARCLATKYRATEVALVFPSCRVSEEAHRLSNHLTIQPTNF
jgi:hypothetical protein